MHRQRGTVLLICLVAAGCGKPSMEEYNTALQVVDRQSDELAKLENALELERDAEYSKAMRQYIHAKSNGTAVDGSDPTPQKVMNGYLSIIATSAGLKDPRIIASGKKARQSLDELKNNIATWNRLSDQFQLLALDESSEVFKDLTSRYEALPSYSQVEEQRTRLADAKAHIENIESRMK